MASGLAAELRDHALVERDRYWRLVSGMRETTRRSKIMIESSQELLRQIRMGEQRQHITDQIVNETLVPMGSVGNQQIGSIDRSAPHMHLVVDNIIRDSHLWSDRAAEARRLAHASSYPTMNAVMLRLAKAYESLAVRALKKRPGQFEP